MKVSFIDVDGVRTRYLHEGSGRPLLPTHPVGTSGDMFVRNIDVLAREFAVYAPDVLGHGFTDHVDFGDEPPQPHVVKHLDRFMELVGHDSYSAGGSSYGGILSALLYFHRPEGIEKLVIIGSGSTFNPPEDVVRTLDAAYENASRAFLNPTWETCHERFATIVHDPATVPDEILLAELTSYAIPDRLDGYRQALTGLKGAAESDTLRVFTRLEEIAAPTLVIVGRNDIRADWRWHEKGVARMPNAELVVFEECGHLPQSEHPEKFNQVVEEFLRR